MLWAASLASVESESPVSDGLLSAERSCTVVESSALSMACEIDELPSVEAEAEVVLELEPVDELELEAELAAEAEPMLPMEPMDMGVDRFVHTTG